jgi:hypothetical protein
MITTRRVSTLTPKADWEVILLVVLVVVSEKNMKMPLPVVSYRSLIEKEISKWMTMMASSSISPDDKGKDLLCLFSWRAPIDCWTDLDCHLFYKEEGGYTQDQMQPRAFENHGNDA